MAQAADEIAVSSAPNAVEAKNLINAYAKRYTRPESARASERPFIQTEMQYAGKDGMEAELRLTYSDQVIPADPTVGLDQDQRVRLRCYNGRMIGPTLRVRPGNKLGITIKNELPVEFPVEDCTHPTPDKMNIPHGWNCTNLHTHGLHVSPKGNADNVFTEIEPGKNKAFRYEYKIPRDHVSGTFWYHPHKHGSVAMQLTTGLAGALIVDGGELDKIPTIRDAFERVMVFQQLAFTPDPTKTVTPTYNDIYKDAPVTVTLINGQLHPVLRVAPGSVERWRFVHGGIEKELKVAVVKDDATLLSDPDKRVYLPVHEIAVDGIPRGKCTAFDKPADENYPVMYPGYRWDVLFKAPDTPGQYFLVDVTVLPEEDQELRPDKQAQPSGSLNYLAKIVVDGTRRPMDLPTPAELAAAVPSQFAYVSDEEVKGKDGKPRICALQLERANGKFMIDKCDYDPDRIDRVAWLNTAEEWHVTGNSHPFHIHVNPFEQIVRDKDGKITDHIWRDTLFVNNRHPATIRMRYKDFDGKTVLHCHILDHEDQGMMENFLILPQDEPLGSRKVRVKCSDQPVIDCQQASAAMKGKPMPSFALPGVDGKVHASKDFPLQPLVLVLFRGVGCLHCAEQLQELMKADAEFQKRHVSVVAVSSDDQKTLTQAFESYGANVPFPFLLLADGNLDVFRAFNCWNGEPQHGLFVIDGARRIHSAHIGSEPFSDIPQILKECTEVADSEMPLTAGK